MKEKIALFFDGANHTMGLSKLDIRMNYPKLLKALGEHYFVVAARYYSGISEDEKHRNVKNRLKELSKHGYTVVTKPVKEFPDGKIKGNVDIEIAVDMLSMMEKLDSVMLFSGDGDFTYLLDAVQRKGVHVTVVSHSDLVAAELKECANTFLDLETISNQFSLAY